MSRKEEKKDVSTVKVNYPSPNNYTYHDDVEKILFTSQEIENRICEMGKQISNDYYGKPLVLIGLMRGVYHILSDLSKHITIPHEIDCIGITTYEGNKSSNKINLYHDLEFNIKNKNILIVDDLVDTAFTLNYLINDYFINNKKGYKSINVCCLLDKYTAKKIKNYNKNVKPYLKYIGFNCENVFVVGYGMDYNQHYRSLPYIGILKSKIYKNDWNKKLKQFHSKK